ncbi:response regulator [Methylocystis sp. L43]|uniref:hybrid sensor histidine kinase/response regulator n=1 Tax=unclassified Methylocystis TaxID=2625913 RepID=UPI0018C32D1A|nr:MULTISPECIES: ATP-binding protein [unclassified Methylocystis]MBG0798519.1 response regulator [Methylocystis sp. L43]MBG0806834.1 response regulator [Methylocystis sp. H15]
MMAADGAAQVVPKAEDSLRVLILTPTGRDAALAEDALNRSGVSTCVCGNEEELRREIAKGAGCVLMAEEALPRDRRVAWDDLIGPEPAWSQLPVVLLLARGHAQKDLALLRKLEKRPSIGFIERPVQKRSLISALKNAIEARRLQYAIRDALDALQTANRRKDEFLAVLAHELRNPLAVICAAIHIKKRRSSDADSDGMLSAIERQTQQLTRIVDDLLEVSRISRGKLELQKERVDLVALVREVFEKGADKFQAGKHRKQFHASSTELFIEGDPIRLGQVFSNLLNNAAKYTADVGEIDVTVTQDGPSAVVIVKDSGVGIPPEMITRVFDIFTQVDRNLGRAQGGIGVGLSLTRSLVTLHGGTIEARSGGAGMGSEFIVRLPLSEAPVAANVEAAQDAAPDARERRASPTKVLVVDDDQLVGKLTGELIASFGMEVQVVPGGAEALEVIPKFQPRVIFVDLGMPGMDGYETVRRIRQLPGGDSLFVAALSGWGQADYLERSAEAGFDRHFVKPIKISELEKLFASEAPT